MITNFVNSILPNSDIEGVMANYEKQVTVVFEPGKPISNAVVLREMFQTAFTLNPTFTYSGHEIFVSGDIAFHSAPWTMTGKTPDGADINQRGLSVAVLRNQQNGKWLIVVDNPHGHLLLKQ